MLAPRRLLPVLFLEAANLTSGLGNAVIMLDVIMLAVPRLVLQETGSAAVPIVSSRSTRGGRHASR